MSNCGCTWHIAANRFCPVQSLNMRMAVDRLKTFTILDWPYRCNLSIVDLAEAGFHYTGTSDVVKCFLCRTSLHDWKSTDVPSEEHQKYSPSCPFVKGERTYNIPIITSPYQDQPDVVSEYCCC